MSPTLEPANGYSLGLTIGRNAALIQLDGEIDLACGLDLTRLMDSLDLLAYMAVEVDLSNVTFLDSYGIRPLVAATRRRQRAEQPPVRIGHCSPAARFYLQVSGLKGQPHLDLYAWGRTARGPRNKPGVVPLVEDDTDAVPVLRTPRGGIGIAVPGAGPRGMESFPSVPPRSTRQHCQQESA